MVGEFSSFIEFIGAVYVTMTINNDVCRRFWNPDHREIYKKVLSKYQYEGSSKFADDIIDKYISHHKNIEDLSQKKGAILLFICLFALIYIGFENGLNEKRASVAFYFVSIVISVCLSAPNFFIPRWRNVLIGFFTIFIISILGYKTAESLIPHANSIKFLYIYRRVALIILLIFPIIHQLFINWLHSSVYLNHLDSVFGEEYDKYNKSLSGISKGSHDLVEDEYINAIGKAKVNNEDTDTENIVLDVLKKKLKEKSAPTNWILIKSWLKLKISKNTKSILVDNKTSLQGKISLSSIVNASNTTLLDFSKDFEMYKVLRGQQKLTLKDFCKNEDINYSEMCAWLKKNLQ